MANTKHKHKRNINLWGAHTSTTVSIALVLLVFGILMFIGYHSYRMTHDVQEKITYKVDLLPDVSDSLALAIQRDIEAFDYVKHVDYISKDEAAKLFTEEIDDDFVDFLGFNPLYPSLMVNLKTDLVPDKDQHILQQFTDRVERMQGVTGVQYQENVINELANEFYIVSWILVLIAVLLLFVTITLINNTIRIAIYAQQQTIQTMRMVGATSSFIARPFLWRSVLYGFLGAIVAIALIAGLAVFYSQQFALPILDQEYWLSYAVMGVIVLLFGILISWLSTAFAVKRYTRIRL